MYTLYYASREPTGRWAVKFDEYERIDSPTPIEGSTRVVSRNHTQAEAEVAADYHQRQSYGKRRQENNRASQD